MNGAGLRGHVDDGLLVVLAHAEVHEMLIEPAISDRRGNRDRANSGWRHDEGIAHQLRAPRLDRVVVGNDAVSPDLMKVVEASIHIDEPIGEAMGAFIEITAWLDESALMQDLSG